MTVGIAAVCADINGIAGQAVVVASDRMVTHGGITEFEHEVMKVRCVADRVLALAAGDALRGARLVNDTAARVPSGSVSLDTIVEIATNRYAELRRQQVEAEVFTPRGVTMAEFYGGGLQQRLLAPIAGSMDQEVIRYNLGVDLLLAGVDDAGAHIHTVSNPGRTSDFTTIGFHAIGSGALHAVQALIGFGHSGRRPLNDTVFTVYASKRRSEVAPGVGKDTDIAIISDTGVCFLDAEAMRQLSELYAEYERPLVADLERRIGQLALCPSAPDPSADDRDEE